MQRKTLAFATLLTLTFILMFGTMVSNALAAKVIVGFKQLPQAAEEAVVRGAGGAIKYTYHLVPAIAAEVPDAAIAALERNPNVAYVEDDGIVQAIGQTLPWGVDRIDAELVHPYNKGTGVKVSVIDTGIDYDHPDLALNVKGGKSFVDYTTDYMDDNGHGTHCSGIVAAVDNDIGVIGVAPEAYLYGAKVLDQDGSGYVSDVVAGIEWSVDIGAKVISMSIGTDSDYDTLHTACDNAYAAGSLLVAAAGNDGNKWATGDNVDYPARYDSVIAVAATDKNDERAVWGPFTASSTGPAVELAAPGDEIDSTYWDDTYATKSGTSMACPHVTGTAALVWVSYPSWTNVDVRTQLQNTADDLGDPGRDNEYGFGLVDADEAAPKTDVHDVAVTAISAPSWCVVGDTVAVDVTVENQGTYDETFDVTLTDTPPEGGTAGTVTNSPQTVTLAAGASTTLTFNWDTTNASTGDHTLEATAGTVAGETDTADNSKTTTVTVKEPIHDVAVNAVNAPSSVNQGDVVDVTVDVENQGTYDETFTLTLTDTTDSVEIGSKSVTLAAGASSTETFSWDTTNSSIGDHLLKAEASQVSGETDTADNSKTTTVTVKEKPAGNANDIYVWVIDFSEKHYGKGGSKTDLMTTVTIRRDSDADGTAESTDELVSQTRVEMTLSKDTGESWIFAGDTGDDGTVTFTLKFAEDGTYTAKVTNVTHATYTYNPALNVETEDTHTIGGSATAALENAYPSPANPETWIPFRLSKTERVVIKIYTVTGQLVRTLDMGKRAAGAYLSKEKAAYWDGRNEFNEQVSSGMYFYLMEAGDFRALKKMLIMK